MTDPTEPTHPADAPQGPQHVQPYLTPLSFEVHEAAFKDPENNDQIVDRYVVPLIFTPVGQFTFFFSAEGAVNFGAAMHARGSNIMRSGLQVASPTDLEMLKNQFPDHFNNGKK